MFHKLSFPCIEHLAFVHCLMPTGMTKQYHNNVHYWLVTNV